MLADLPVAEAGARRPRAASAGGPPEHRGHGYATDASAHLSQMILDEGASYSSLFADIHNPRTNKIYQMIGYEEIGIHNVYSFAQ